MATQFHFKREWLEDQFADDSANWFAKDILENYGNADQNGICSIPSRFIVYTACKPIIQKSLAPVLNHMGFRIIKIENIHGCFQSKITILPFPCRTKELHR